MGSCAPMPSSTLFIFEIAFKGPSLLQYYVQYTQMDTLFINSDGLLVPIKNDVIQMALLVQNKFAFRPSNSY